MSATILVTRPAGQAAPLSDVLRAHGIGVVEVPAVEIDTASCAADLDRMLDTLDTADWLVITSANGATALAGRLHANGRSLPSDLRVAAVGPTTADALTASGIRVDHVPGQYLTVAIVDGLGDLAGRRVVLARADAATPALRDALRARGARLEEVVAYRTVEGPPASRDALRVALERPLDGIAFTSGSTVRGLLRLADAAARSTIEGLPAYCIGPVTADVARRSGLRVAGMATTHTAAGLARTIASQLAREIA
ncbi:MAG TPA: uroporphyrinogen-III synthase [Candidatus Limnocylindria bacterium]|nr:uroporphyrinogen-III synthase [Candidatus Limnocylindria bacterium]